MKKQTAKWLEYADRDYELARSLLRRKKRPVHSHICFLSQQSAEKYLKAFLIEHDLPFEKTHNLARLIDLILTIRPEWELYKLPAVILTRYAVEFRYPGDEEPNKKSATDAMTIASDIRTVVLTDLKY
ncbi:MAG TPA: HEPN domain-containing protein [Candidatus Kapabacteria bacterium]|nr:HEPN domain-containing protein [Candidatus Kapabacteria bacterium]